jgi:hypothetical protein
MNAARRLRIGAATIMIGVSIGLIGVAWVTASPVQQSATTTPAVDPYVYRIAVEAETPGGTLSRTEWIAPVSGAWRREDEGATKIFVDGSYVVVHPDQGANIRTGSASFLGHLPSTALSRGALQSFVRGTAASDGYEVGRSALGKTQLRWRANGRALSATIEERISRAEADQRELFDVPKAIVASSATERPTGAAPELDVEPYWFGPATHGRRATMTIEHAGRLIPTHPAAGQNPRGETLLYITFYELPGADGKTSATPGEDLAPEGEIQVVSQPASLARSKAILDAFGGLNGDLEYGAWPQEKITLADGTPATVVINRAEPMSSDATGRLTWREFWVVTDDTLTAVSGSFTEAEIPSFAAGLRRVPQ